MTPEILNQYYDRIYGYAHRHTFNEEEAADLTQDILYTVLTQLPTLKNEAAFEGWLWSIAANVTRAFRRKMGRQRAMFVYDMPEDMIWEDEYQIENEELYASLRARVAGLSQRYRDIVIMYYYDSLSTKQIADRLDIPEGTVTWRLSEARRKLKKECMDMETIALRPQTMTLDIYGSGNYMTNGGVPFPNVYISDALSQNILYHCYEEAQTVETLSKQCGVPAYYIEDSVNTLLSRRALIEQTKDRYRTDFLIWSDKYGIYGEEHAEASLMPVMERMLDAFDAIAKETAALAHYRAEKNAVDLYYLYGVLAMDYVCKKYCSLPYPPIPENYDGFCWRYIGNMETGAYPRISLGFQHNANNGSGGSYSHTVYYRIPGFAWRNMMYDYEINVCEDILTRGTTEDSYSVAEAVCSGYLERAEDGTFIVKTPAFTHGQKAAFDRITERHLSPLMTEYAACVNDYLTGYRSLFPPHLRDDADRMCQGQFFGLFAVMMQYAQRIGRIQPPTSGSICDVLIQFK